ncbi:MAG TPA: hypothetical protein VFB67_12370 [Candidatus Polarisedimenticolaceae bacterium]|nr:hypothetical protein [Candidatus Polarisedimenticolaceae bacterium]
MRNVSLVSLVLALLAASSPISATPADVHVTGSTVSGNQVAVTIQNVGSSPQSTRIQVSAQLANGSIVTLLSAEVSVGAGSSAVVTVSASAPIVAINEDPQPIPF